MNWRIWQDWSWSWHGGNPPMRGWGSVVVIAAIVVVCYALSILHKMRKQ